MPHGLFGRRIDEFSNQICYQLVDFGFAVTGLRNHQGAKFTVARFVSRGARLSQLQKILISHTFGDALIN